VRVLADRTEGARCRRGEAHARQEATDPRRTVTTTVAVEGSALPVVPVRTSAPVPRDLQAACVREISRLRLRAPLYRGQVVLVDLLGLGVDVVVTRSLPAGRETLLPMSNPASR